MKKIWLTRNDSLTPRVGDNELPDSFLLKEGYVGEHNCSARGIVRFIKIPEKSIVFLCLSCFKRVEINNLAIKTIGDLREHQIYQQAFEKWE